jgi:hypothetical protein
MKFEDLSNKKFNKLLVIKRIEDYITPKGNHTTQWLCICECGNQTKALSRELKNGHKKSCGCLLEEFKIHGLSHNPLYGILSRMYSSCYNNKYCDYEYYGGRGITLCDQWNKNMVGKKQSMINFYNRSMGNGYKKGLTIDRINNNGNYSPDNCRWATVKEQCNNRRSNHILFYKNEKFTMQQASEKFNINYHTLKCRLKRGWSVEKSLETKVKVRNNEH